jgi:hypothetical protein
MTESGMISEILDRAYVLQEAARIHQHMVARPGASRGLSPTSTTTDSTDLAPLLHKAILAEMPGAVTRPVVGDGNRELSLPTAAAEEPYISGDPIISIVQSVLELYLRDPDTAGGVEKYLTETAPVTDTRIARRKADDRIFEKFSVTDIGWVSSAVAVAMRKFLSKRKFNAVPAPSCNIADKCRLVVVGDWGSGIPRAQRVALAMREHISGAIDQGLQCHVIHLGDVYYSGFDYEYRERFLPYWPVRETESSRVGSWCLNGNHDMYSGGYGYFDYLLADPRFARQNRSSFFRLANSHWQFLGLDTAWDENGLKDPQASWIREQVASSQWKTVIMTHHQLFSVREDGPDIGKVLRHKLGDVLSEGKIDVALWGHEHRFMTYEPYMGVKFPRLIGHGGVPAWADKAKSPLPFPGQFQSIKSQGGGLFERFANMGFAVLDFDGPTSDVSYYSEDGSLDYSERL